MVGLSLLNPISIGAGLLLGGKTISDERRRVVARRQAEAKMVVRRYVDDVSFQVGKDSRDMLRGVQRDLRDHFTTLAEQLNRSLKESLTSAERSVTTTREETERRLGEIETALAKLDRLQQRVRTLTPEDEAGGAAPPAAARPVAVAR
jgi:ubiquinone biosynthesis protein UbiJ